MERDDKGKAWWRTALTAMAGAAGDDAAALARIAVTAADKDLDDLAVTLADRAAALAPDDAMVRADRRKALSSLVPRWHFLIVRDAARNAAYRAALERAIRPGDRVLDIGAGTGLLGMMAARAGAGAVTSCEMNAPIAAAATRIVAANGLADRVRIVAKHSAALDLEADLGGRVDVVVSEILANDLLGEYALAVMADVVPRLLAPGGRVIPETGAIVVAPAWWDGLEKRSVGVVDGFDLSAFDELDRHPRQLDVGDAGLALAGRASDLFAFDFAGGRSERRGRTTARLLVEGGRANGVAQWIRIGLDAETVYESRPAPGAFSCWACLFHPLDEPAEPGDTVVVDASHDGVRLRIVATVERAGAAGGAATEVTP
ncbi:50S ribosomal protein L11 methyltransferase [Oharaeibacter diazotrophicus]|uniref:Ribosomal protein L11 methyltransferase PrmA n=1 Tax=Oharaeibacter diazotrophicus TaxID=1920512 RepID=A0A4R6RLZ2_9HYPH|nr:class I SAM-dependent methyltransferase [Oharaeibacter diazotrophicus]TDP87570.1 ribosomal protein L11 methyltransferase PrmA [Oharaeibacter diazotrophicus]GLS77231.1 hypothetical protein GCM10007904_25680 [Oharaeibacter diazotrophicus]